MTQSPRLYDYREIRSLHLELTSKCQAACPMCGRNVRGGATRDGLDLTEMTLDDFQAWISGDLIRQLNRVTCCGNYGDPIIAADCVPILAYLRAEKPDLKLTVLTNGSARDKIFWQTLAQLDVAVHFALDGATPESHQRYRRHTQFDTILRNAATFIEAGGRASWVMLAFRHNDHEIETARKMASDLGFHEFLLKSTNRFGSQRQRVDDTDGNQIDTLYPSAAYPPAAQDHKPSEAALRTCDIRCKVAEDLSLYIDASGSVFPCCWIGSETIKAPGRHGARVSKSSAVFHEILAQLPPDALSLRRTPLPVIVNRFLPHFAHRWVKGPERFLKCATVCGKFDVDAFTSTVVGAERLQAAADSA